MRNRRFVVGAVMLATVAIAIAEHASVQADLENQVFSAPLQKFRVSVPRSWRATDQPSYPGILLWMLRSQPRGQMLLTAEDLSPALYCSWPRSCREREVTVAGAYVCDLRNRLDHAGLGTGPMQPGPKENVAAGFPSVWFEYSDAKKFMRQAIAVRDKQIVSLVLSAETADLRASHVRAFEQVLRSLRRMTEAEIKAAKPAPTDGGGAGSGSGSGREDGRGSDSAPPASGVPSVDDVRLTHCPDDR